MRKVKKEGIDYHEMVAFIEKKYSIQLRDYHKNYPKSNEDWKSYMDFWHWMLENCFSEVSNGCFQWWNMLDILEDEETPDWIKEITQLFYNEFKEELDADGGVEVYISW